MNVIIALAYIYMLVMIGTLMFAKGWRELSDLKNNITRKEKFMITIGYMVCHSE